MSNIPFGTSKFNVRIDRTANYLRFLSSAENSQASDAQKPVLSVDKMVPTPFGVQIPTAEHTINIITGPGSNGKVTFQSPHNEKLFLMAQNETKPIDFCAQPMVGRGMGKLSGEEFVFMLIVPPSASDFKHPNDEIPVENDETFKALVQSVHTGKFLVVSSYGEIYANEQKGRHATEFVFESKFVKCLLLIYY